MTEGEREIRRPRYEREGREREGGLTVPNVFHEQRESVSSSNTAVTTWRLLQAGAPDAVVLW